MAYICTIKPEASGHTEGLKVIQPIKIKKKRLGKEKQKLIKLREGYRPIEGAAIRPPSPANLTGFH